MIMLRTVIPLCFLGLILSAGYFLPKVIQDAPGFAPLADQMATEINLPTSVKDQLSEEAQATLDLPIAEEPAPAASTPVATASAPPAPAPAASADLTPIMNAMAIGDLAKAAALLDVLKDQIPADKHASLTASVETARKREADLVAAAHAPATPAPTAASKVDTEVQLALVQTLREMQKEQKETAKVLSEIREQKASAPPAPAAPASGSAASEPAAAASGPLPGTTVVLFNKDSAFVALEQRAKLKDVIALVKSDRTAKVELRGFADKGGNAEMNLGLSRSRAGAVQDLFRREGIEDARVTVLPMGSFTASDAQQKADELRKVEVLITR
jgi:outer membrane protein OmpA-like peptidoglycan-associated protein